MYKIEVKSEIDEKAQPQCRGCLSKDRKLSPIGLYKNLFCKLLVDNVYGIGYIVEDIQLCWECMSLLRKVSQFQKKLQEAHEMLQRNQNFIYGSLSSLTTVITHDTHSKIIYVNETNLQSDIAKSNIDQITEYNHSREDNNIPHVIDAPELTVDVKIEAIQPNDTRDTKITQNDDKHDGNIRKTAKSNRLKKKRWAEYRALQNRLPKFKILSGNELTTDMCFRRVQIDIETVKKCLMQERDDDSFRKNKFRCESCVIVFRNETSMMEHNQKFHKMTDRKYICDICNIVVPQKSQIIKHIKCHTIRYKCVLCECIERSKDKSLHIRNHHRSAYQCLRCILMFRTRQEFSKHYKDWHEKFICHHCGVSFKLRYCIEEHIKKQHSPFKCDQCPKQFRRYNGLWYHKKVFHTTPNPETASHVTAYCVECDKRFPDVYRYKWHIRNSIKHTPRTKKRVPCPDCDKVFSKSVYMRDHRNFVHLKCFNHRCEDCDKNFVRNADLVKHMKRVHEGKKPPRNKICYVCGKGFTTNEILKHHIRTHTGARPHTCASCPAAFAQRVALRAHQRTHAHD